MKRVSGSVPIAPFLALFSFLSFLPAGCAPGGVSQGEVPYVRAGALVENAEYAYYDTDISTSFPANGRFTPEQRKLYELGLDIRQVCLDNYRAGASFSAVGEEVRSWLIENGQDPSERRFRGLIKWGCSNHPIGMATHDVMDSVTGPDEPLPAGFVFACDINMPESETMGIRIEDTVVITEDGHEILSAGLPRTVEEIEALMKEEGLLQKVER